MNKIIQLLVTGIVAMVTTSSVWALEVDREVLPRVTLGGRVITTLDSVTEGGGPAGINTGDSSLMMRFDKRVYGDGVAGAVLGISEHGGSLTFSQLHAFYWNRDFEVRLGRMRLPNTLIEFPLIRDDDMLSLTHVGNASSNSEYDQTHGTLVMFKWFPGQGNTIISGWLGTRSNDPLIPTAPDGFDSYSLGYEHAPSESYQYLKRVRHFGVRLDAQQDASVGNPLMQSIIIGGEFNLNLNPQASWSIGAQYIGNGGVSGATVLTDVADRARVASNAVVVSLRYVHRPHLLTRWQTGLVFGAKQYTGIAGGSETSMAASYAYRLGQGIDVLAQWRSLSYGSAFGGGSSEQRIQFGLVFSLDAVYNNQIGARNSILNLEHGYIQ